MKKALPWCLVALLLLVVIVQYMNPRKVYVTRELPLQREQLDASSPTQQQQIPNRASDPTLVVQGPVKRTLQKKPVPAPATQVFVPDDDAGLPVLSVKQVSVSQEPDTTGEEITKVFQLGRSVAASFRTPKWSPDGTRLAYEMQMGEVPSLRILTVSTGASVIVQARDVLGFQLAPKGTKRSTDLAWSPDGRAFLFSGLLTGGVGFLYHSRDGFLRAISSLAHRDTRAAWSPNGRYVAFSSTRTGKGDLYLFRADTHKKAMRLTRSGESSESFPSWSPRRSLQLAYVRFGQGVGRVYVMDNVFVKRAKRLTTWHKPLSEGAPSWSPDGRSIAFFGYKGDDGVLVHVDVGSRKARVLVKDVAGGFETRPAWSPEGHYLFCAKKSGEIQAVHVRSGKTISLATNTYANNELALVSHQGRWSIAYTGKRRPQSPHRGLFFFSMKPLSAQGF